MYQVFNRGIWEIQEANVRSKLISDYVRTINDEVLIVHVPSDEDSHRRKSIERNLGDIVNKICERDCSSLNIPWKVNASLVVVNEHVSDLDSAINIITDKHTFTPELIDMLRGNAVDAFLYELVTYVMSIEEQNLFMRYSKNSQFYDLYMVALGTGMRNGELRALQWADIDFDNKIIHVNGTLKYIAKAKVKYMIDEPKSETSKRDIPMLDNLVTVLREHRKRQLATRMLLGDKWRPEPGFENLVFTGSFGRCISENALYQDMKKIIVQIREDGHTFGEHTPHSLRHTFATRGFERGIPPKVMQEILGHKSITMTLDIYSHVLPDKKAEEINKLAAMF